LPRGGGELRLREVEVTEWAAARDNYTAPLARALDRLMEIREPARGRLLVWRGPPGTGALPTLLNLTDGILGHGTGTLVLVTTNEPVEHVHPAVRRRGRCLADLEFGPLSVAEARAWLARAGCSAEVDEPHSLAELFALADGGEAADEPAPVASAFGFGRALVRVTGGA
jgi:hypothetical protein